ncbi:TRAP transporter small permease [Chachezhania sediminis]|uniref:TRAP transporter small permease n=1 Tax=Chachezhania sediminis TaxID=2599291 RepID=UPI00131C1B33|nr:TRAP transporter small permease [Chachezhania sediminis]
MATTDPDRAAAGAWAPVRWMIAACDVLAAIGLMAMMGTAFLDVIGRTFLQAPIPGATEITELAVAATVACVFPSLAYRAMHATIDVLDVFIPDRLRVVQDAVVNVICAIAMGFVAWRVWIEGDKTARFGGQTALLEVPLAPVLYGIAVFFAISAAAFLYAAARPEKLIQA